MEMIVNHFREASALRVVKIANKNKKGTKRNRFAVQAHIKHTSISVAFRGGRLT